MLTINPFSMLRNQCKIYIIYCCNKKDGAARDCILYNTEVVYTTTLDGVSETVDERGEDYYNGVLEQRDDGDGRK